MPRSAAAVRRRASIQIPAYISPIAIIYNLPGRRRTCSSTPDTLAGIFNQKITTWNDPAIASRQPGREPAGHARSPRSTAPTSRARRRTSPNTCPTARRQRLDLSADGDWPVKGGEAAEGTSGVVEAVTAGDGTIGYADASQAGDLGIAKIKVGDEYVAPTPEGAAAGRRDLEGVDGRRRRQYMFAFDLERTTTEPEHLPDRPRLLPGGLHRLRRRRQRRIVKALLELRRSAPRARRPRRRTPARRRSPTRSTQQIQPAVDAIGG